jgi:DNA end-binding protein Ku
LPKSRESENLDVPEELAEGDTPQRGARPFWSGTISFGLVTIPVDLYAATRGNRTSLRMLAPDGTPLVRRYFDEQGKPIEDDSLERGYAGDHGGNVVVSDEELESLAPRQSRDIDLTRFVDRDSIPSLFFERAYILAPSGNTNLAYRLLASTLERTRRAGIASFVMRGKQYVVAIASEAGLLRAETLRFAEELRTPESIGLPERTNVSAAKTKEFRSIIHQQRGKAPSARELGDAYWARLESLVANKRKSGEDVVRPEATEPEQESAQIIDLLTVLRRSLSQADSGNGDDARANGETKVAKSRSPKQKPVRNTESGRARPKARLAKGSKDKQHSVRHRAAG